jgi:hypothetical protein
VWMDGAGQETPWPPNGLELSCPAEVGNSPLLYGTPAGQANCNQAPARRVRSSELLGGQKTLLASSRSKRAGGYQALDLGDHVVDAKCEGAAEIVPSLDRVTEIGITCAHQDRMVCDGQSLEHPIRGCVL